MSAQAYIEQMRALRREVQGWPHSPTIAERLGRIERLLGMDVTDAELEADRCPHLRVRVILRAVCFHMGVAEADVTGRSRVRMLVRPRAAVCWLARTLTGYSLPQIGAVLGGRDHSTILNLLARAERLRGDDTAFRRVTDRLLKSFNEERELPHDRHS
jgi:chromosomal replication initiation ATPase DnaA